MIFKYFKVAWIATPIAFSILVASASLVTAQTTPPHQDIAVKPLPDSDISESSQLVDSVVSNAKDNGISTVAEDLLAKKTIENNSSFHVPQQAGESNYNLSFTKVNWIFAQSTEENSTENSSSGASAEADANNPLANFTAVNFQNYYIGDLTGPAGDANQFILRVAQPFRLFNVTWLGRLSLPVNTFPSPPDFDSKTGLGDLNLFTAALIDVGDPAISFGVGPLLTFPTATETNLGSDKWTIGAANVFFNGRSPRFQYGYLLTYEHSFAGNSDRDTVSRGVFQPFGFYQLGKGWYLRTAPIWFFNFENGDFNIPLGLGAGKVIQTRKVVYNFFLEPQYIVASEGNGQPEWQLYFALNLQIKK